jgi:hypothetical protein
MLKLMCLLLLEQFDMTLHIASYTLSLSCDVRSSNADVYLDGANGTWAGILHKCLHMTQEENI